MTAHNNDFTIVMPIAYTDREKKTMQKSIESAISLNPGEILFGIDEGTDPKLKSKIKQICDDRKFDRWIITEVKKDNEWKFQLANVIWHCYEKAKFDKILSFDIDSALLDAVMLGYDQIGKNNLALVSFTKKPSVTSLVEFMRYMFYRYRIKTRKFVFAGVYWIYRPYFYQNVDLESYRNIENGIDTYLVEEILKRKTHKLLTRKEFGVVSFDTENPDYPWRQFDDGVWYGANRHHVAEYMKRDRMNKNDPMSSIEYFLHSHTILLAITMAILRQRPYFLKGYRWACKNTDHDLVKEASKLNLTDWGMFGNKQIKELFEWERKGTGF